MHLKICHAERSEASLSLQRLFPMRLFVALHIEHAIRQQIATFLLGLQPFAPEIRWVKPESLHLTLKFIGEQSVENLPKIQKALAAVASTHIPLAFRGYGFFPSATAPRVFWAGVESPPALPKLAEQVDIALSNLGIPREALAFTPHVTLARSGSGAPRHRKDDKLNLRFDKLQQKLAAMHPLDFSTMTAQEFFLYESKLAPGGSQYRKISSFPLRLNHI